MATTPPLFKDLGKSARDIFDKGYDYPKVKLSLKTKTESGVEFDTKGSHDLDTWRTCGSVETKLKFPEHGVTLSEQWNTKAELDTELTYEPCKVKGLKLSLSSSFFPSTGNKSAKLKANYIREYFSGDAEVDMQMIGPVVGGSAVLMYNGWYAGCKMTYNSATAKLSDNIGAFGYQGKDFTVHASLANVSDCTTSVYHKVSNKTEVGLNTTYNLQTSNAAVGLVGKYTMNDGAQMKAKVNNQGQVGIGYSQNLRDGVKLSLSALVEGKQINTGGGHKLGLALDFEP